MKTKGTGAQPVQEWQVMSWTDERVETLKRMWTEGQSASQIATELGGVTRNAVIGKVHRLGLSNRNEVEAAAARLRAPARARVQVPPGLPRRPGWVARRVRARPVSAPVRAQRPRRA